MRHWQPLLRRYNTALNTACRSTLRGLVRFRTPSNKPRINSNRSPLTSLGYALLDSILYIYRQQATTTITDLVPFTQRS